MNRGIGLTVIALLSALLLIAAAPGKKTLLDVKNASMEQVPDGKSTPAHFPRFYGGLALTDGTVAFDGKRSVKMLLRGKFESFGMYQMIRARVPVGKTCRFRVRVRTHDLAGRAYLMVYRYPAPFKQTFRSKRKISGTNEWTALEASLPAKAGGDAFMVRMMVDGTWGRVWWDQLEGWVEE